MFENENLILYLPVSMYLHNKKVGFNSLHDRFFSYLRNHIFNSFATNKYIPE